MAESCPFDPKAFNQNFDHHNHTFGLEREAIFDDLRARCPMSRTEAWGGYVVLTRYEDILAVARDDATFTSELGITVPGVASTQVLRLPIGIDPPRSFLYRNILMRYFRASRLEALGPWVEDLVSGFIDEFIETGKADLQTQVSHPLTAKFIMHVTGLPKESWYEYSAPVIFSVGSGRDDTKRPLDRAATSQMLSNEINLQRTKPSGSPDDKVLPFLLNTEIEGRKLTHDEIMAIMELLLDGGFDTTLAAIGHSLLYLSRNHDKRRQLVENPALMPAAVEEFLRWVTPQQGLFRTATKDADINGTLIREGERVFLAWPSANHDPEVFPDPHEVRFDRESNRHLAFGSGAHLCLGLNVARLEMRVAFEQILRRLPDYEVDYAGIVRPPGLGIVNGLEHLPVTFTPGARVGKRQRVVA